MFVLRLLEIQVDPHIRALFTREGDGVQISCASVPLLNPDRGAVFINNSRALPTDWIGGREDTDAIDRAITVTLIAGGVSSPLSAFDTEIGRNSEILVSYDHAVTLSDSSQARFYVELRLAEEEQEAEAETPQARQVEPTASQSLPFTVPLRVSRSSVPAVRGGASSLNLLRPRRYIVLPGNYSGDSWATAACLLLDPDVRVVVPTKSSGFFDEVTQQFLDLCTHCQVSNMDTRVIRTNTLDSLAQVSESQAAKAAHDEISNSLQREDLDLNPRVGWTFATSSIIARQMELQGVGAVLGVLERFAGRTNQYDETLQVLTQAGPCVLVNMRIGRKGNHPQHDINPFIYQQICSLAAAADKKVVRIGDYQDEDNTPGGSWMTDLAELKIELFRSGVRVPRSATAFFWLSVSKLPNVFGVIGGRSGSLDIASFMGVRTLCWDVVDVHDHEYVRQFLYRLIQSICPRDPCSDVTQQIKNKAKPYPKGLVEMFVRQWFNAGNVVPSHGTGMRYPLFPRSLLCPVPLLKQITGRGSIDAHKRLFLDTVEFMSRYTE